MKVIEVTGKNIDNWDWSDNIADVINLWDGKEIEAEWLTDKIKTGKVAVVSLSSTVKKNDIETLLNNNFEVLAMPVADFKRFKSYYEKIQVEKVSISKTRQYKLFTFF